MLSNVGMADRFVRLLLASGLFYLGLFHYSGSALGIVLDAGGAMALLSGLVGFCGLYQLLGINTCRHS